MCTPLLVEMVISEDYSEWICVCQTLICTTFSARVSDSGCFWTLVQIAFCVIVSFCLSSDINAVCVLRECLCLALMAIRCKIAEIGYFKAVKKIAANGKIFTGIY